MSDLHRSPESRKGAVYAACRRRSACFRRYPKGPSSLCARQVRRPVQRLFTGPHNPPANNQFTQSQYPKDGHYFCESPLMSWQSFHRSPVLPAPYRARSVTDRLPHQEKTRICLTKALCVDRIPHCVPPSPQGGSRTRSVYVVPYRADEKLVDNRPGVAEGDAGVGVGCNKRISEDHLMPVFILTSSEVHPCTFVLATPTSPSQRSLVKRRMQQGTPPRGEPPRAPWGLRNVIEKGRVDPNMLFKWNSKRDGDAICAAVQSPDTSSPPSHRRPRRAAARPRRSSGARTNAIAHHDAPGEPQPSRQNVAQEMLPWQPPYTERETVESSMTPGFGTRVHPPSAFRTGSSSYSQDSFALMSGGHDTSRAGEMFPRSRVGSSTALYGYGAPVTDQVSGRYGSRSLPGHYGVHDAPDHGTDYVFPPMAPGESPQYAFTLPPDGPAQSRYYDEFADPFDDGQLFGGVGSSTNAEATMYSRDASSQAWQGHAEWDHPHAISYDPMQGASSSHGRRRSPH